MKIFFKLIINTLTLATCFIGLHFSLVRMAEKLYPLVDNFKLLLQIYSGILDGEFALIAMVVLLGVGSLLTLVQLLIGE